MKQKQGEILNLDPETNPKLKEIFDILLLAGYFRIRIPSITPLDKILGGLSWCITQSNFNIDIEYSDEFNIGQKIKVSEAIVKSLEQMSCPSKLQPHQIQGLDLAQIYPVVQWLIKFVIETREFRQDQNKRVSRLVGKNSLEALLEQDMTERRGIKEVIDQLDVLKDTRQTKNLRVTNKRDPLRVYSTLIEYGDLSSQRTYNKLCAIIQQKQNPNAAQQGGRQSISRQSIQSQQQQTQNIQQLLFTDQSQASQSQQFSFQKVTVENLQNLSRDLQVQTQAQIAEMSKGSGPGIESTLNEEEEKQFQRMGRKNSIVGQNIQRMILDQRGKISESLKAQEQEEDELLNRANMVRQERELNEQQMALQSQQLANLERKIVEAEQEIKENKEQEVTIDGELQEQEKRRAQMGETLNIIEGKINQMKLKKSSETEIKKAEEFVFRRNELKEERSQLKKEIKDQLAQLEREKQKAEKDLPKEEDLVLLQQLKEEYGAKKQKYDKKFTQFAQLNQELAVLQRKIENYPSTSEIAQYQQRFIELYDSINQEMEEYKKQFIKYNNLQDIKQLAVQFVDIMRTFKENYQNNLKDKKGKQELAKNLDATFTQLQQSLNRFSDMVVAQQSKKEKSIEQYRQLLQLERDYYRLLKEIKLEFEKNEILIGQ